MKKNINERFNFYNLMFKNQLEYKFSNFWGDAPTDSIWGWKDPSVSIFLPIWKNIFPKCKLMIIIRNIEKISKNMVDLEGEWFRKNYNDGILKYFYDPDISNFSEGDVFNCEFNKVVTSRKKMNEMFEWIGLEPLHTKEEFLQLLQETGYEGRRNNAG